MNPTARLIPLPDLQSVLQCPRCRAPIRMEGAHLGCSSPACPYAAGSGFPLIGRHPALVDFTDSILSRDELERSQGASPVARGAGGPLRWIRALHSPVNRVAERHSRDLLSRLRGGRAKPRILIVGGGTIGNGAHALYEDDAVELVAFDIYASPFTQFIGDAHRIPLADRSVDAVWVQAVLEHVLDPGRVVRELERVLTDQGLVYAETPFLQQVHEGPFDFTRFTESGHRWLFRRFRRLDSGVVAGPGTQLSWTIDHAVRSLFRSAPAGRAARILTFWTVALDALAGPRFAVDDASCVFFYGQKSDGELSPREIIEHYQGAQRRAPRS